MICPVCGHNNLQGADECENCGTDLRTSDIPHPGDSFERRLVAEPLARVASDAPLAVSAQTPVADAVARMREASAGCVVVEQDGRVCGIFTERDALLRLAGRPFDGVTMDAVMTRDPVVLRRDDSIAVAIHKMAIGGFRHIPLVENGQATGMVSAGDIFRYILEVID
jgi:CBS domain-containing protein